MSTPFKFVSALIGLAVVAGVVYLVFWRGNAPTPIGGDRDEHGCLVAAGYSFDLEVGACARAFELTADIRRAAQIAVQSVGPGYALTVVSFNSYEATGTYDITLERGVDRQRQTVYIKNWQVQQFNFIEDGVVAHNNPGQEPNIWYLVYEKPGSPALSVKLNLNSVAAPSIELNQGERVHVTGERQGDTVVVYGITSIR